MLFRSNNEVKVEIFLRDENIWLTQEKIATLFGVDRSVITKHLKNIFKSSELKEDSVCAKFAHTASDGKNYQTKFYNLDAIISVGYRVNSIQATNFRIWATEKLKEYIIKGFAMDDERLKDPRKIFGKDYFDEQLERIRDIRSSERRFYQKITDIYSQCSIDYDKNWRNYKKYSGGGILIDQGIHMLDLMRLFAGEFNQVSSFISNGHWNHDVEDNAYALMKTEDNIVGFIHSSATQWRHRFNLEINLQHGSIILGGIVMIWQPNCLA